MNRMLWIALPLMGLAGCSTVGKTSLTQSTTSAPTITADAAPPPSVVPATTTDVVETAKKPVAEQAPASPVVKASLAPAPEKPAAPAEVKEAKAEEEPLTVKTGRLKAGVITLAVKMDPTIKIAQIQVDGAYREFTQSKQGPGKVRIDIPYPWMHGEAHHVAILTSNGSVFEHEVDAGKKL